MTPGIIDLVPPSGIPIGPIDIGFYGLGYVLAVVVLLWISGEEARRRGIDPARVPGALITVAICALIGARLYHVIDQWAYYSAHLDRIVLPPYSGLGLYGGIAGAIVGITIEARRHHVPVWRALDVVVPGTFFAQAIARWGNFFNQELYGPPASGLPWSIRIDCAHRVDPWTCDAYPEATTGFHPLFLYESLLDLAGGLVALWLSRRRADRLRDGDLAAFWMIWYGTTRFLLETLRYTWDWKLFGLLPTAMLVSGTLIVAGTLLLLRRHRRPASPVPPPPAGAGGPEASEGVKAGPV
ncbi:MAG: prolipoprotein diacylglyceryl transferase [Chloroflexota bacterium]